MPRVPFPRLQKRLLAALFGRIGVSENAEGDSEQELPVQPAQSGQLGSLALILIDQHSTEFTQAVSLSPL